jgi:DNA-binding response OmpR family regulator
MKRLVIGLATSDNRPFDALVTSDPETVRLKRIDPDSIPTSLEKAGPIDVLAVDGDLSVAPVVVAMVPRLLRSGTPVIALTPSRGAMGVTLLMTGADFCVRPPLAATTVQALLTAFQRRAADAEPASIHVQAPCPSPDGSRFSGDEIEEVHPVDEEDALEGDSLDRDRTAHRLEARAPFERSESGAGPHAGEATSPTNEQVAENVAGGREGTLHVGPVDAAPKERRVWIEGQPYTLTPTPMAVLVELMRQVGSTCTREDLLQTVWGLDFDPSTNVVDAQIYVLRQLLKKHKLGGMIQTVRSQGYRLLRGEER